ncbi:MAG: 2-C-methyl-D-erythritol 2,4-cyclodiphosphate synthase [Flavobacteriales bacterium]
MKIRVGSGFDVHQLREGRKFILGGVEIPSEKGILGHSDADVLIHALCDALLGAAGLKDIGFYFPDTSTEFKGIDSCILLERVMQLLRERSYTVGNVDSTVVCEKPKIKPYVDAMKSKLSSIMGIDVEDISIKATTNEKMGFIGREEGIVAYASVLIFKN